MTKSKYLILVIVLLLVLLGEIAVAVSMFSVQPKPVLADNVNQAAAVNNNLQVNRAAESNVNTAPVNANQPATLEKIETKDCGTNWLCFDAAASHCSPATLTDDFTVKGFLGMDIATKTLYEIKGKSADGCILYQRVLDQTMVFSAATRQKLVDRGVTQVDLDKQIAEPNRIAKQYVVGRDGQCWFDSIANLVLLLTKIEQGNLKGSSNCSGTICTMSGDFSELSKRCSGKMFEVTVTPAVNAAGN